MSLALYMPGVWVARGIIEEMLNGRYSGFNIFGGGYIIEGV